MTIGVAYVALFVLGVAYALLTGLLGWIGDIGGGGDVHVDASGHLDAGHAHPLSGTVIASFVTGFGGGGILAHYVFHLGLVAGSLAATVAGVALGASAFFTLELLFRHTEAGSEFAASEAEGAEAEVITGIPPGGTGEVAYLVHGARQASPARSADGSAIAKGRAVVIEKVMGSTLRVRPKP